MSTGAKSFLKEKQKNEEIEMKDILVRYEMELHKRVDAIAKEHKLSHNQMVINALEFFVESYGGTQKKAVGK